MECHYSNPSFVDLSTHCRLVPICRFIFLHLLYTDWRIRFHSDCYLLMVLFIDFLNLCSTTDFVLPSQRVKLFQVFPYVAGWCLFLDSCCLRWICIDWKIRSYSSCYFPLIYINTCTLDYAVLNVHAVTTSLFLSIHRHIYIWP